MPTHSRAGPSLASDMVRETIVSGHARKPGAILSSAEAHKLPWSVLPSRHLRDPEFKGRAGLGLC